MEQKHKDALRKNQVILVENIEYEELADHLKKEGLFTPLMLDEISPTASRPDKVRKLLVDLPRRGSLAFDTFCTCLVRSGQDHLAKLLEDTLLELQGGNLANDNIKTSRFLMEKKHKDALTTNQVFLVEQIQYDVLADHLKKEAILSSLILEDISPSASRPDKVRKLLVYLPRRGPVAFAKFCTCLVRSGQEHLAKQLEDTLLELQGRNLANAANETLPHGIQETDAVASNLIYGRDSSGPCSTDAHLPTPTQVVSLPSTIAELPMSNDLRGDSMAMEGVET